MQIILNVLTIWARFKMLQYLPLIYEGDLIKRPQMDVKCKICVIRTWKKKKRLFLDLSSTNIDILVPSLYQCVQTRNIESF
jgi:hypothetical protein